MFTFLRKIYGFEGGRWQTVARFSSKVVFCTAACKIILDSVWEL